MIRVSIETKSHPYAALIEQGVLRSVGVYVRELLPNCQRFFAVSVAPVRKHYGKTFAKSFAADNLELQFLEMPDGERRKTLSTVQDLGTKMVKLGADRNSCIIALGGGVVGDVAGFLSSIYMRGVKFLQVPTTFLAQVDSSVGGKTGVNLEEGKNLLGTFKQPNLVIIDPEVLVSLPEREYRSGLYEALKYGIIRNPRIFEFMEENRDRILKRDPATLEWLIAECVRVKASVVAADEEEHGVRRILNLGHTIGHALEAETGYRQFLHGEAVAWGMVAAAMISVGMQKTDSRTAQRIISAILAYAPLPKVEVRGKALAKRIGKDKKTVEGRVHFILPVEIGKVDVVSEVPERAVLQSIEELRYLSQA
ncbi:MAG TPA: 3-dehydroquinate synthase [Clostridia bacterium]|nr:3-dehydroquinate synthase [Clostridia bacterium]